MTFDIEGFRRDAQHITPMQKTIRVEQLAHWFKDGEEPEWVVRGLTASEVFLSLDVEGRNELMLNAAKALLSATDSDQLEAFKEILGQPENAPRELAKRFDWLMFGSVSPKISRQDAVLIFNKFPNVGYSLSAAIGDLTDGGPDMGKVPGYTKRPES